MMKRIKITNFSMAVAAILSMTGLTANAKENVGVTGNSNKVAKVAAANCNPTTAQADLDINNIRTTVLVGGDMWWDLSNAKYEVPINSDKHSIFAGALWIGGIDAGGQIKVAAQTYRQTGIDFWGGPIDTSTVTIQQDKCQKYDRHWKVTKDEVRKFADEYELNPSSASSNATNDMKNWPGNGDYISSSEGQYLAPFVDVNGDGDYDYTAGDYPGYFLPGALGQGTSDDFPVFPGTAIPLCNDYLFGDKTIWWVFNDVGNAHTETNSEPIGLEIRAQAFGFKTNDEINNMTFYKYQIINRSTLTLTDTYFGQWVDPDLGNAIDDFVGCDVPRGLGYCYNGDADDETGTGYGLNPPAIGVDFFQGPLADINDGVDNDRDGCTDCTFIPGTIVTSIDDDILPEQIIMSKFVYYNNVNNSPIGNPNGFTDFYNYLRGIWLDNQPITYGGDGRNAAAAVCDFMFPGNTDPINFPVLGEWSEFTAGNIPEDRRCLQSAGTFTLTPGAVNYITTGVVWARAQQGGPLASVDLVRLADDKAQALFNNCFKLIDGPDAPDLVIRELDKRIILSLHNYDNSNIELYAKADPTIVGVPDSLKFFTFQGYQIYQLADGTASTADIGNPDKIRLLLQCDVTDGVAQIVNFNFEPGVNANVPVEMVNGADKGIQHTFVVNQDLFATGTTSLINHKTYYYTVVSYAYNQYKKYDPNDPAALDGQKKPYLAGRNNIKTYTAIPHIQTVENSGQIFGSEYGFGPKIKRIEGQGNGGIFLDFANNYDNEISNPPYRIAQPEYFYGEGPLNIKVYDPILIKAHLYETRFDGVNDTSNWTITNLTTGLVDSSERTLSQPPNEQILPGEDDPSIPEWGLTAQINKVAEAGKPGAIDNAYLGSSISYANPDAAWLNSIVDIDGIDPTTPDPEDWIRSGDGGIYAGLDDDQIYEGVVGGTWGPYKLCAKDYPGPKFSGIAEAQITLSPQGLSKTGISSVNIVLTADKSKWTRSAVIEIGGGATGAGTIGSAKAFDLRKSPSIGKNGQPGDNSISAEGMSWFPGYAVNLETGERLNIAFGENSLLSDENGTDMKWNPTATRYNTSIVPAEPVFGGMHFIYIFGHNGDNPTSDVPMYDSCRFVQERLATLNNTDKRNVWKDGMYASLPLLASAFSNLNLPDGIPSDVTVKIRVAKTYRTYATSDVLKSNQSLTTGTTYFVASTPVIHNGTTYSAVGESFVAANAIFTGAGTVTSTTPANGFNPLYTFGTEELANNPNNASAATSSLDLINVVPNPYYAFSSYEENQLDNRIKITNLPANCTVSIFTMGGTLVRKFKRDVNTDNSAGQEQISGKPNSDTSLDWNLKNQKGIPIASGMYLIHIDAPGLGERTLKWFGMIRPIDLDTF
ncbi:MAG: hypothetical protein IPP71_23060 [Bacteroidetes bacterium]|nr:hypothetical protein [Bacteroidota bacterium]